MAVPRTKAPAIGSAQWVLDERQQSNDLLVQELEDFGFSVRNELEWLNEHMAEIFAQNGQNSLDVFKTPGKLRGKTPRTARKKLAGEVRQPLVDILDANAQNIPSPALQSLRCALQKPSLKANLNVEDHENVSPIRSPHAKIPALQPAFSEHPLREAEISKSPRRFLVDEGDDDEEEAVEIPAARVEPNVISLPEPSSQDTVEETQEEVPIFTQETFQSTQPTQPAQSFRRSLQPCEDEQGDVAESFVSAKEGFANKDTPKKPDVGDEDCMEVEESIHITKAALKPVTLAARHAPLLPEEQRYSEQYSIGAETYEALETANRRAPAAEPKHFVGVSIATQVSVETSEHEDTILHHDAENETDADDDDARSPSDDSSPAKLLMRKSSFTFASLPAREPFLPKKSLGDRMSRTSFMDQSKMRSSQYGRFTGGKSLGGSQYTRITEGQGDNDDEEERPTLPREESETTKMHNAASTKSLKERLNMLNQRTEPPKRISQSIVMPPPTAASTQTSQPAQPSQHSQPVASSHPVYPTLPADEPEADDDDDDSWISPIRNPGPAPYPVRPLPPPVQAADSRPSSSDNDMLPKATSVEERESTSAESTTPPGSPELKKYADGPLGASRAKFYSALRAAKEKIIGSSAASAQVKMDALAASPMRASPMRTRIQQTPDMSSPKRSEKPAGSIFSHSRSPSKNSVKTLASHKALAALTTTTSNNSSPVREDMRKTRSSSERGLVKEKETREKEEKQKQRTEDRLREMREKEQAKAAAQAAHYQKAKTVKTPAPVSAQSSIRAGPVSTFKTPVASQSAHSRPGTSRMNTAARQLDPDSADEMPPPPPPKSLLPTGTAQKLRDPKRLINPTSKETLPKGKPQKIQVNLNSRERFGQAPAGAKLAPTATAPKAAPPPTIGRQTQVAPKIAPFPSAKPAPSSRLTSTAPKPAPRMGRTQPLKAAEKPKPAPAPASRADLGGARPLSRMQTVQDAARINVPVPPVNPAKPPVKRPFQVDSEESLHRPAKRPSQQARSLKPMTPAHAQFAQGRIPFAEPAQPVAQTPHFPNGEDIKLPDIMTDSEDEDSENEFEQPSWVATPNLRSMLEQQQLVDPEQIFGPIAPLNMEQVFPNKERHKRFRERTSSAYWTNDQVTEEERRKEREARERLVREGAWTYNPSPRPTQPYR